MQINAESNEFNRNRKMVCLQIHNDYQIPGGETKTASLIADLLEEYGIKVIRYYKTNTEFSEFKGLKKVQYGIASLYNYKTKQEIKNILDNNKIDFALVHNVIPVISNSAYDILLNYNIPIIKYIQNYNLVCLNGAIDKGDVCEKCKSNSFVGVSQGCYKGSKVYSLIKYLIKKDFDRNYFKHIAAFMPNSKFVKDRLKNYGMDSDRMFVMYNYISLPLETEFVEGKADSYYLYYGRISKEKGVITLIKAFTELKSLHLIIMGSGEIEDDVKKLLADKKLNNIDFIGSRSGTELHEIVAKAKCVIVPSEWDEPLPRTILESYALGTPVIGADRGGIPEMIENGDTGFVFSGGDYQSLIENVELFESLCSEKYNNMCKACVDESKKVYSKDSYFERFSQCIESVI